MPATTPAARPRPTASPPPTPTPQVRQGLKTFSNWPTYPQLYADGSLLGGLDIVKEMQEDGELRDSLPAAAFQQ